MRRRAPAYSAKCASPNGFDLPKIDSDRKGSARVTFKYRLQSARGLEKYN
jgi:hypothetical protein